MKKARKHNEKANQKTDRELLKSIGFTYDDFSWRYGEMKLEPVNRYGYIIVTRKRHHVANASSFAEALAICSTPRRRAKDDNPLGLS